MKRRFLILLVLLAAAPQGACSFLYSYVLVNSSQEPISVELRFKKNPFKENAGSAEPAFLFIEPKTKKLEDLTSQTAWQSLPANQVTVDKTKGEMRLKLQPSEVLKLHQDSGTTIREVKESSTEPKPFSLFPIASITLTGKSGRIVLEGDLIPWQFREFAKNIYQIQYKPVAR